MQRFIKQGQNRNVLKVQQKHLQNNAMIKSFNEFVHS